MNGPPQWKLRLGALASLFDDPGVTEVFVAGDGRTTVTGPQDRWIVDPPLISPQQVVLLARQLADGIAEPLGAGRVQAEGVLDGGFRVRILMPPLVANGPAIAVTRAPRLVEHLDALIEAGRLPSNVAGLLDGAVASGVSTLLVGPRGSGRTALLGALAATWSRYGRVAWVGPSVRVDGSGPGEILMVAAEGGVEAAVNLGVDAIVVDEPSPADWAALLLCGRAFLATVESPTIGAGLRRVLAQVLFARAGMALAGAEALVASSLGAVAELERGRVVALGEPQMWARELGVRNLGRASEDGFELTLSGSALAKRIGEPLDSKAEAPEPQGSALGAALIRRPSESGLLARPLADIPGLEEDLGPARIDAVDEASEPGDPLIDAAPVEETSIEAAPVGRARADETPVEAVALGEGFEDQALSADEADVLEGPEATLVGGAPAALIEALQGDAALDELEPDTNSEPFKRSADRRISTLHEPLPAPPVAGTPQPRAVSATLRTPPARSPSIATDIFSAGLEQDRSGAVEEIDTSISEEPTSTGLPEEEGTQIGPVGDASSRRGLSRIETSGVDPSQTPRKMSIASAATEGFARSIADRSDGIDPEATSELPAALVPRPASPDHRAEIDAAADDEGSIGDTFEGAELDGAGEDRERSPFDEVTPYSSLVPDEEPADEEPLQAADGEGTLVLPPGAASGAFEPSADDVSEGVGHFDQELTVDRDGVDDDGEPQSDPQPDARADRASRPTTGRRRRPPTGRPVSGR